MEQSAPTIKKLSLELGGNAPFIVSTTPTWTRPWKAPIASKYRNAGQTCVCVNRLYIQDGVYDALLRSSRPPWPSSRSATAWKRA